MKKIETFTKRELLTIVRNYNVHHVIKNYSKLKKAELIAELVKHVNYNENTHAFSSRFTNYHKWVCILVNILLCKGIQQNVWTTDW